MYNEYLTPAEKQLISLLKDKNQTENEEILGDMQNDAL